MRGEIFWTEESEAHIARHGVAPHEVEEAVFGRPQWMEAGREETTLVLGRTDAGRYLFVVLTDSYHVIEAWYVVTARDMTRVERQRYDRKAN
ncbi:uncharacterized DUF497 family protein [Crossiella equi]|uniref:Uncharacterized DUF497 family protein n=1 Tax=Crossiella equi TaxID=130796 RepID=A0ABS5AE24_9PSEU|nr:BrnT family toxin [Crossiella equi]MBP2473950.1 uncharacterized DUF497 family protein [Crossiella equi]